MVDGEKGEKLPLVVTEFYRTCYGCPSQWEGYLKDGRGIYVRYRYGHGIVEIGETIDAAIWGELVFEWKDHLIAAWRDRRERRVLVVYGDLDRATQHRLAEFEVALLEKPFRSTALLDAVDRLSQT